MSFVIFFFENFLLIVDLHSSSLDFGHGQIYVDLLFMSENNCMCDLLLFFHMILSSSCLGLSPNMECDEVHVHRKFYFVLWCG